MKILALTFGDMTCASSYYRIGQYIDRLRNDGIECDLVVGSSRNIPPGKLLIEYDVVLVQKNYFHAVLCVFCDVILNGLYLILMTPHGIPKGVNTVSSRDGGEFEG